MTGSKDGERRLGMGTFSFNPRIASGLGIRPVSSPTMSKLADMSLKPTEVSVGTAPDSKLALLQARADAAEAELVLSRHREAAALERVRGLEVELQARSLEDVAVLRARLSQVEQDLETFRAAKRNADLGVLDLKAQLKAAKEELTHLKRSPTHRLGEAVMAVALDWRRLFALPAKIGALRAETRKLALRETDALTPTAATSESLALSEAAIARADKDGVEAAAAWVRDQRPRASVLSRALLDLARHVRQSDPGAAVSLARAAVEADPNEGRVKHLAFVLMDVGEVSKAIEVTRAALAGGVPFNATEMRRHEELSALERLKTTGAGLPDAAARRGAAKSVLLYAPQSLPSHWSATSLRTHALALAFRAAGWAVEVVTAPGYPANAKTMVPDRIDGIVYNRLPAIDVAAHLFDEHARAAGRALAEFASSRDASVLVASTAAPSAHVAAIAARLAGLELVLDCITLTRAHQERPTERDTILIGLEDELLRAADAVLVRDDFFGERLSGAGVPADRIVAIGDAAPTLPHEGEAPNWRADPALAGRTVLGYIGDPHEDLDLESLPDVVAALVAEGLDVGLALFGVGTRFQKLRDRAEQAGLGGRVLLAGRPRLGQIDEAFEAIDVILAPASPSCDRRARSRFEIAEALAHRRVVIASGPVAAELRDRVVLVGDGAAAPVAAIARAAAEIVADPGRRAALAAAPGADTSAQGLATLASRLERAR